MEILRRTFGAETWRRVAYGAVSAPVGLAALGLTLTGQPGRSARLQQRVVQRLLGAPVGNRARLSGTIAYALLSIPLGVVGLWLALLLVPNTIRNLLYGFVVGDGYTDAWGGPTLAGAWTVHAVLALALVPVGLWLVRGLTALQRRLAGALLGGGRVGVPVGVTSAVVVLAGAVFLDLWVHQV
ncbi:MAG TPA: hypothetical protein VGP36_14235 [Mycobacteriales bacterium]|jgi:hypothetical protein|nr:hypothetical protein [Mycobacteriales bacterium]